MKEDWKDNTYYDKKGRQILSGDLLKVFHFYIGKKKKAYMYLIPIIEDTTFGYPMMRLRAHYTTQTHCFMFYLCDNEKRVYKEAEIIGMKDWQTKRKKIKI